MYSALIILSLLQFKHLVVDGFIQSRNPYQWQQKGTWGAMGGVHHASLHGVATFFILLFFTSTEMAFWLAIAEFEAHYFIDWSKMNINRIKEYTPASPKFWDWLMLDQFAHQMCYVIILWFVLT